MKIILGVHYDRITNDILEYLKSNEEYFNDKSIFDDLKPHKVIPINKAITSYSKSIIPKIKFIERCDDNLRWLTRILVGLYDDDFKAVVFFSNRIDKRKISTELLEEIELLKRLANLFWEESDEMLVPKLKGLMEILPHDISAIKLLTKFYENQKNDEQLLDNLNNMLDVIINFRPTDLDCLYFTGNLYKGKKEYPIAIESYKKSIICCTRNNKLRAAISWICLSIAECYLLQNNAENAIHYTSYALSGFISPKKRKLEIDFYKNAFHTRCKAYFNQHDYELALQDINSALKYSEDLPLLEMKQEILNRL